MVELFSKEDLIQKLQEIAKRGWIKSARSPGNVGAVGNTLEDLLGIDENNLPIPNAAEWELKAQRANTSSLTTLFHSEPSPRGAKIVPSILLPLYGWSHKTIPNEKSFRSTTGGDRYTDRGFIVQVDRKEQKVKLSFSHRKVTGKHNDWLKIVENQVGLGEISPQPYWGLKDLEYTAGSKLKNTFYVIADNKRESGVEYFHYKELDILCRFDFENFLTCLESGVILVDFDARTGHNHGTKFRIRQNNWPKLYDECQRINLLD